MINFGKKTSGGKSMSTKLTSVVSENLKVKGDVFGTGSVEIAGELEGNVKCSAVHLHQSGKIKGNVVAKSVFVDGLVTGTINASQVNLSSNAHVKGEVFYDSLSIKDGAVIEGSCQKMDNANAKASSVVAEAEAPSGDLLGGENASSTKSKKSA